MALDDIVRTAKYALLGAAIPFMMYGCKDNGTGPDPKPPKNKKPTIELNVNPTQGTAPQNIHITTQSQDPDGSIDSVFVDLGQGFKPFTTDIDTNTTYNQNTTIQAKAKDNKGAKSNTATQHITIQQPPPTYEVTLQLRNLTQDGEPFETDGQTTYTIGNKDTTITGGQITLEVEKGTHQINATHPNYYPEWTFIREKGMTMKELPIEQRDSKDTSSPIDITKDITLQLYKINKNDIESLTKPYAPAVERDNYNMEDMATVLDGSPPEGTDRYLGITQNNPLTVWINTQESKGQPTSEIEDAINEWTTTTTEASAHHFTQGYLGPHNMIIQQGGEEPNGHHIEIKYDTTITQYGLHGEALEDPDNPNKITRSVIRLNPDKAGRGVTLEELTQSTGARDDIINRLEPDLTGKNSDEYFEKYGTFGTILGKLLYTTHAGTNYKKE